MRPWSCIRRCEQPGQLYEGRQDGVGTRSGPQGGGLLCSKYHERPLLVAGVGNTPKAWAPLCPAQAGRQRAALKPTQNTSPATTASQAAGKLLGGVERDRQEIALCGKAHLSGPSVRGHLVKIRAMVEEPKGPNPRGSSLGRADADTSRAPTVCLALSRKMKTGLRFGRFGGPPTGPGCMEWFGGPRRHSGSPAGPSFQHQRCVLLGGDSYFEA